MQSYELEAAIVLRAIMPLECDSTIKREFSGGNGVEEENDIIKGEEGRWMNDVHSHALIKALLLEM